MNLLLKAVVFLSLFIGVSFSAISQKSRIGYINSNKLWELMPEKKEADSILKVMNQELGMHFTKMQKEFEQKFAELKADSTADKESLVYKSRTEDLKALDKKLRNFKTDAEKELVAKKEKLYAPIKEKMQNAIDAVADKKGLEYVLDSSFGNILYRRDESYNLMEDVKTQLKLKN